MNTNTYQLQQQTLLRDLRYWEDGGAVVSVSSENCLPFAISMPLRTAYLLQFRCQLWGRRNFPRLGTNQVLDHFHWLLGLKDHLLCLWKVGLGGREGK